jgi:hypothetical protein
MQHSLKNSDMADALSKEVIEKLMEEYKNVINYIVENKLDSENAADTEKEQIIRMANNYLKVYGEEACDVFLHDALMIYQHASYFDVDLDTIK